MSFNNLVLHFCKSQSGIYWILLHNNIFHCLLNAEIF